MGMKPRPYLRDEVAFSSKEPSRAVSWQWPIQWCISSPALVLGFWSRHWALEGTTLACLLYTSDAADDWLVV